MTDKLNATARLIQGFQIALDDGRAHSVLVDLPSETTEGFGPTSLELCVMSHAGCYAVICALMASKMRIELKGLEVRIEALKTNDAGTITEENFSILIRADATDDRIQRLHELTLKNCPVGKIFEKAGVRLDYIVKTPKE